MDGAFMVLAYDAGGEAFVSEETGKGHSHSPNAEKRLLASAVREADGKTILEFSLPAGSFVSGTGLKVITAYGRRDDRTSFHARHAAQEIQLAR
jgi:hypothetical protein